jgi:hypothetical protein
MRGRNRNTRSRLGMEPAWELTKRWAQQWHGSDAVVLW